MSKQALCRVRMLVQQRPQTRHQIEQGRWLLLLGLPLMLPLMTPLVPPEMLAPLLLQVGAVDERLMGLATAPAEEIVAVARRAASSAITARGRPRLRAQLNG